MQAGKGEKVPVDAGINVHLLRDSHSGRAPTFTGAER